LRQEFSNYLAVGGFNLMGRKFRSLYIGALAVIGVGLLGTVLVPKAHADTWDKKTIVTVNEPVIAGDKVLQPGTYVWKLLDSQSNRHIVQIFDRDQRYLENTILAIPNYRLRPAGKSQFAFWETPAGVPKAVRAWFYPGDNFGQEFAYPKKLVAQLAAAAPVPMPMEYKENEAGPAPAPASVPEAQSGPASEATPTPVVQPAPQPWPEQTAAEQAAPAVRSLPHTASSNALIGFVGLGFLSLSGIISLFAKKNT
jgi:LPXTG-motif cell wall-anchored protein